MQVFAASGPLRYASVSPKSLVKHNGGELCLGEYGLRLKVPELVLAPRDIDFFQVTRQAHRYYVGSCVDIERHDAPFDWGPIDKGRGFVYCSLGTYNQFYADAVRLFRSVIEGLRNEPHAQAILQVGSPDLIRELGPQPERIRVVERAPQLEILRHANLFITHGGIGAVREGLFFGVPMIVFPCWLDQPGNAARLAHHGLAVRGNIRTVDAESLRLLTHQASSAKIRRALEHMRETFKQQEDCMEGVQWIQSYLAQAMQ
jgi:zeaxanthin glucosyltransferase